MDIFKFRNPTASTRMEQGEIVDGFKSKMWVERYRPSGEFSLVASIESGVREKLPLGTFISHVDTKEIMIVENHEISENRGEPTDVVITGRGFESYFENRIVGANRGYPVSGYDDYVLGTGFAWYQAIILLQNHIMPLFLVDVNDSVPFVLVTGDIASGVFPADRSVKVGDDLYSTFLDLLAIDNAGVKVSRPNPGGTDTTVEIHVGVDRSASVVYSYDSGEIESADYLWSIKPAKTSAFVSGKWVLVRVDDPTKTNWDRRMMHVDASDIDEIFVEPPTGAVLDDITAKMQQRGLAALAKQKEVALAKAEISKENTKALYRRDFNVGDFIMVNGDYNQTRKMRVTEFVEIEDEHGQSAYPTLSVDE